MARSLWLWIFALILSCGGDETAPILRIDLGLVEGTDRLALYFYEDSPSCTSLRETVPRARPLLGPFLIPPSPGPEGTAFTRNDVPAGEYSVLVDALSLSGAVIGSGCAEGQLVLDGRSSKVAIAVEPI